MTMPTFTRWALTATAAALLAACGGDGDNNNDNNGGETPAPYTLQLLHFADMDGATGALQNVEPFSAVLDKLRSDYPDNTLVLSSGDNFIPGPRYFAAADDTLAAVPGIAVAGNGRADIALVNALGVQASVVGNHDLDGGTEEFASIIGMEGNPLRISSEHFNMHVKLNYKVGDKLPLTLLRKGKRIHFDWPLTDGD